MTIRGWLAQFRPTIPRSREIDSPSWQRQNYGSNALSFAGAPQPIVDGQSLDRGLVEKS
ncbi:hypothetical protein QT971_25425 [Microcoleus sp. herbarium19]|uniref:hypothetical protein n=1 Tax=unclassified Microcoleus TaxID=2642155 RepID=UPI002FD2AF83